MLDKCSKSCFIENNVREECGAFDKREEIIIRTLNGEQEVKPIVVSGLRFSSHM